MSPREEQLVKTAVIRHTPPSTQRGNSSASARNSAPDAASTTPSARRSWRSNLQPQSLPRGADTMRFKPKHQQHHQQQQQQTPAAATASALSSTGPEFVRLEPRSLNASGGSGGAAHDGQRTSVVSPTSAHVRPVAGDDASSSDNSSNSSSGGHGGGDGFEQTGMEQQAEHQQFNAAATTSSRAAAVSTRHAHSAHDMSGASSTDFAVDCATACASNRSAGSKWRAQWYWLPLGHRDESRRRNRSTSDRPDSGVSAGCGVRFTGRCPLTAAEKRERRRLSPHADAGQRDVALRMWVPGSQDQQPQRSGLDGSGSGGVRWRPPNASQQAQPPTPQRVQQGPTSRPSSISTSHNQQHQHQHLSHRRFEQPKCWTISPPAAPMMRGQQQQQQCCWSGRRRQP